MYSEPVWIVSIVFMSCSVGIVSVQDSQQRTYIATVGGLEITCNLCPPGTHWSKDCTVDRGNAECIPCEEGITFNPNYNRAVRCATCTGCRDEEREDVVKNCTPISNVSCQCKSMYYRQDDPFDPLCIEIDPCPPGSGVSQIAGEFHNTKCESCKPGKTFSNKSSKTEGCLPCRTCKNGLVVKKGSCGPVNDAVCVSFEAEEGLSTEEIVPLAVGGGILFLLILAVFVFCVRTERGRKMRHRILHCQSDYDPCEKSAPIAEMQKQPVANGKPSVEETKVAIPDSNLKHPEKNVGNGYCSKLDSPTPATESTDGISKDTLRMLMEDLVHREYPMFFRLLFPSGMADKYIEEMKLDYERHGVREIIYQLLVKWKDIVKGEATADKVITALKDWGRVDLVEKYYDIFSQSELQMESLKEVNNSDSTLRNSTNSTVSYSRSNEGSISTDI